MNRRIDNQIYSTEGRQIVSRIYIYIDSQIDMIESEGRDDPDRL